MLCFELVNLVGQSLDFPLQIDFLLPHGPAHGFNIPHLLDFLLQGVLLVCELLHLLFQGRRLVSGCIIGLWIHPTTVVLELPGGLSHLPSHFVGLLALFVELASAPGGLLWLDVAGALVPLLLSQLPLLSRLSPEYLGQASLPLEIGPQRVVLVLQVSHFGCHVMQLVLDFGVFSQQN